MSGKVAQAPLKRRRWSSPELLRVRFALRWSIAKRIDGLWVGCFDKRIASRVLDRVEAALQLIRLHDPLRYARICRDLERILVTLLPGNRGQYHSELWLCELDERFVVAEATTPEQIASVIVHEATHARLMRCGIGYDEAIRLRVEAICFRRQIAFADTLPNGAPSRDEAERNLNLRPASDWTNDAMRDRHLAGVATALRYGKAPEWFIRMLLASAAWVERARRAARRLRRSSDT